MKVKKIFLLLLFLPLFSIAKEYKVSSLNGKIVIEEESGLLFQGDIESFFKNLKNKDNIFFRRGDAFNISVSIKNKENIFLGSFGEKSLPKPKITSISPIPFEENENFEIFYSENKKADLNDSSFKNLILEFDRHYSILSTSTKRQISKEFEEVKDFIDYILRIKLPTEKFRYFDPNALRVWLKNKEILRLMLFEELKCKECKEEIRWFFEKKEGYLYLFIRGEIKNIQELKEDLKINNLYLDTISIQNSKNIIIRDLQIEGGKYAIALRGTSKTSISDSIIGKGSFVGVEIANSIDSNASSDFNIIENCKIDSGFYFSYRFHSSRGSQDGIFLLGRANFNTISNNTISNWGHSGINLYSPQNGKVSNNYFVANKIEGSKVPYMHGFSMDGKNTSYNRFTSNIFTNLGARNQLNGVENAVYRNYFANIYNSQIKKDQGYGSGQAIWLQSYGDNACKNNYVTENIFINCDEAAVSIVSYEKDGIKTKNTISGNFIINCGTKIFNKPYQNCVFEIFDEKGGTVKENNFVNNKIFNRETEPKVFYRGEILSIEEFNKKIGTNGDFIVGNKNLKK